MAVLPHLSLANRRAAVLIRGSDTEVFQLVSIVHGRHRTSHGSRQTVAGPGDLLLCDASHSFGPASVTEPKAPCVIVADLPRNALPMPASRLNALRGRPLSGSTGLGLMVSQLMANLTDEATTWRPSEAGRLGTAALDLIVAFLAQCSDAPVGLPVGSRREELLTEVCACIERQIGDPDLSPAAIARSCHISVRYLHLLFEQLDTTVCTWIRDRRLDGCRRDLTDPLLTGQPIRAIAARWGFASASDFSRVFRSVFGITAGDFRRQGLITAAR